MQSHKLRRVRLTTFRRVPLMLGGVLAVTAVTELIRTFTGGGLTALTLALYAILAAVSLWLIYVREATWQARLDTARYTPHVSLKVQIGDRELMNMNCVSAQFFEQQARAAGLEFPLVDWDSPGRLRVWIREPHGPGTQSTNDGRGTTAGNP